MMLILQNAAPSLGYFSVKNLFLQGKTAEVLEKNALYQGDTARFRLNKNGTL